MSKENMTIDEVKEMACAIIELNREGGDFMYSPSVSLLHRPESYSLMLSRTS